MSIIVRSIIFLKRELGKYDSVLIDEVLNQYCDEVNGTRKGRVWEIVKNNMTYSIQVCPTEDVLIYCEDEMLDFNFLPDDVPEVIFIVSLSRAGNQDLKFCSEITREISIKLMGITNGASFSS